MPKAPVKKKTAKKPAKAMSKKPASKRKAKPKPPEPSFMWKLLKRKEAERMEKQKNGPNPFGGNPDNRFRADSRPLSYAKFQGPRRRAA